jgi:hypothetical protein
MKTTNGALLLAISTAFLGACEVATTNPTLPTSPTSPTQPQQPQQPQAPNGRLVSLGNGLYQDTQLGWDCTFTVASDGNTYCLPQVAGASFCLTANYECSEPVADISEYIVQPELVQTVWGSGAGGYYTLGAEYTGVSTVYDPANAMLPYNPYGQLSANPSDIYVAPGTLVPLSSFVAQ